MKLYLEEETDAIIKSKTSDIETKVRALKQKDATISELSEQFTMTIKEILGCLLCSVSFQSQ